MNITDNIVFVSSAPDAGAMAAAIRDEIADRYTPPPPQYRIIETASGEVLYELADMPALHQWMKGTTWQEAEIWHVETVNQAARQ